MFLIVGLGNPGPNYSKNRHNIGFLALDQVASSFSFPDFSGSKVSQSQASLGEISGHRVLLLKPMTYMNLSGSAVKSALDFFKLMPERVIVLHDDLDLDPGEIRFKKGGGHGGHNGLRSVSQAIGQDYYRLRLGIGHPGVKELVSPYVLSNFSPKDTWVDPLVEGVGVLFHHLLGIKGFENGVKFMEELKQRL